MMGNVSDWNDKRIGFVSDQFPKLSETFVMDQMLGLLAVGADVRMYAQEKLAETVSHPRSIDLTAKTHFAHTRLFPWVRPHRLRRKIENYVRKRAMKQLLVEAVTDCDLVLCHFGPSGVLATSAAPRAKRKAQIWTIFHGYDVSSYVKAQGVDAYTELFSEGDRFLAVSKFWAQRLILLGCPPGKLAVLHMGVDTKAIQFNPRPLSPTGPVKLLFVGRLAPKKGPDVLLRALARLREVCPSLDWEVTFIGDGGMRAGLEAIAADLKIADRVIFCGAQSSVGVRQRLAAADFFVLPSLTAPNGDMEGIPVALMEAMAAGVPVITTDHSGIPELVEHKVSGLLAIEADPASLCAHILQATALDPNERRAMQLAARAKVEQEFDQGVLLKQLSEMIAQGIGPAG